MKKFFTKKVVGLVVATTILGALALGTVAAVDTACHRVQHGSSAEAVFKKGKK